MVGLRERWGRELPGLVAVSEQAKQKQKEKDRATTADGKMKIAWRYERLGQFDDGPAPSRGGSFLAVHRYFDLVMNEILLILTLQQIQGLNVREQKPVLVPMSGHFATPST